MPIRVLLIAALLTLPVGAGERKAWDINFDDGSLTEWHLPLKERWKAADGILQLDEPGVIGDPRRPTMFALFKSACIGSFDLSVDARREGRSLMIAFGFQDRAHFYYAHVSSDDGYVAVHNGLFMVNGGERFRIAGHGSAPVLPKQDWHRVRVVRDVESGKIEVYADDDPAPRFSVTDKAFTYGWVGLGSFNESGDFDNLHIDAELASGCEISKISPLDAE